MNIKYATAEDITAVAEVEAGVFSTCGSCNRRRIY